MRQGSRVAAGAAGKCCKRSAMRPRPRCLTEMLLLARNWVVWLMKRPALVLSRLPNVVE